MGMRPLKSRWARLRQWAKLGKVTTHSRPMRSISSSILAGWRTDCRVSVITTMSKLSSGKLVSPASKSCSMTFTPLRTQVVMLPASTSRP